MLEQLLPIDLPPGFVNNGTKSQAAGRWYTGSLVRFRGKVLQPIGGWLARTFDTGTMAGIPRAAHSWLVDTAFNPVADFSRSFVGVGTTSGLYYVYRVTPFVETGTDGWSVSDITPSGFSPNAAATWHLENFGKYLIATANGNAIYVWNPGIVGAAVASNTAGAFGTTGPSVATATVTTPERFLFLLGGAFSTTTVGITSVAIASARRTIMWASQETITDWTASATNTAGDFELATQGIPLAAKAGRGETLIWTTADMWRATYIGGTLVYSFTKVGDACGIVSTNAATVLDGVGYWMGDGKFFRYNGTVQSIPCDVEDYVFGSFNQTYAYKVWCLANPQFNEVTWFYPSANATEIDSYVTYDYDQNHWTFGALVRTTGVTRHYGAARTGPVMFDASHIMYDHEIGDVRTQDSLGAHLTYAESGPIELENGDKVMRVQRIVPDDKTAGDVSASLYTSMYPDGAETTNGPYTLASPTSVRLTARRVRLKITEAVSAAWRVGTVRLGVIPGGRR
jgi:hypothetical protein